MIAGSWKPTSSPAPRQLPSARAFTLVELVVTVTLLTILAGIAISAAGNATEQAAVATTQSTLGAVRDGIVGSIRRSGSPTPCFLRDLGRLPTGIHELLDGRLLAAYDPALDRGWRGPYVLAPRATFGDLDAVLGIAPPMWATYGQPDDAAVLDGWGRPLVLQVPDENGDGTVTLDDRRHVRLVSAGPDARLDTPRAPWFPPLSSCDDDIVLYLRVTDLRAP